MVAFNTEIKVENEIIKWLRSIYGIFSTRHCHRITFFFPSKLAVAAAADAGASTNYKFQP